MSRIPARMRLMIREARGVAQDAGLRDLSAPRAGGLRAAPPAWHLDGVLAGVEQAASRDGQQVSRRLRRGKPSHGANSTQQFTGGEPQLAAAQLLHPASSS